VSFHAPHIDYAGISPVIALTAGLCVVLLTAVFKPLRRTAPALTMLVLAAAAGLLIWQWGDPKDLITGALRLDDLAISISLISILTAGFCILLSAGEPAADEAGRGEYHALLLGSVLGMVLLAQATNLVTFFVAIETLSIPLYILCATNLRREGSLESGLKYLIVGSLGSATLLYGMAFLYGGTGSTGFEGIAAAIVHKGVLSDPLILIGIAMALVGLAFKTSIAPFHQWTPDVYEGAPTPITSFMAVATKAAAFAVFLRFFDVALGPQVNEWQPALAALAAISILVGNVGALAQSSLKRLLGYSGIAQAGYMLGGIVVASSSTSPAMPS
jgi:NADH-quinone oxidoreductase subunit N